MRQLSVRSLRSSSDPFTPQFAVLMWLLTYVGALFNGLTLLLMGKDRGKGHHSSFTHLGNVILYLVLVDSSSIPEARALPLHLQFNQGV